MAVRLSIIAGVLLWATVSMAGTKIDLRQGNGGITELGGVGDGMKIYPDALLAGEDQVNNLLRVEHQYSRYFAAGADTLIKTGIGYVHSVVCWGSDAAATAGTIDILDSISAGAGTKILSFPIAAGLLLPQQVILDVPFITGLYVDFTTTNDVTCTVSGR